MLFGLGLIHSHYVASKGTKGVEVTTVIDQELKFPLQLNAVEVFAIDTDLEVYFNNDPDPMFIAVGEEDGITGLPVNRVVIKGPVGQKFKWRGLTSINNT